MPRAGSREQPSWFLVGEQKRSDSSDLSKVGAIKGDGFRAIAWGCVAKIF